MGEVPEEPVFYRQNTEQVAAELFDEEFVLINFALGTYFSLKNAAVDVWQHFETGAAPEDVADRFAAHFSLAAGQRAEVDGCIRELVERGLLCATEAAGPAVEAWSSEAYAPPLVEVYSDLQDLIVLDPVHEVDESMGWPTRPGTRDGS